MDFLEEILNLVIPVIPVMLVILVLTGLVILISHRNRRKVASTSLLLKAVNDLNEEYDSDFKWKKRFFISEKFQRKSDYNKLSCNDVVLARISNNTKNMRDTLQRYCDTKESYNVYLSQYNNIAEFTPEHIIDETRLFFRSYEKLESKLFKKARIPFKVRVKAFTSLKYTSPKGKNTYRKSRRYKSDKLEAFFIDYDQKVMKQKWALLERSRMTPSMRHDVLARDGFRCVYCGAKAVKSIMLV